MGIEYKKKPPRISVTQILSTWWITPALAPTGFTVDTENEQVTLEKEGRTFIGVAGDFCVENEGETEAVSIMTAAQIAADWELSV